MFKKKWEKSKLWKKLISGAISLSLFLSFVPISSVTAYNVQDKNTATLMKEWLEQYQKGLQGMQLGVNPYQKGVDVYSEEYQQIIVEFKALPKITARALNNGNARKSAESAVDNEHTTFKNFLEQAGREKSSEAYEIQYEYEETFNGVSMTVKGTDIPKLLESGVVSKIWLDEEVKVDPVKVEAKTAGQIEGRMATSTPLIGVDKLREEGITGEGIKVGVIDTGIDYNHPDLKDNYKGGYDLVDNDDDPMETTYQDWENSNKEYPADAYITSHGTHVAGTIAATGKNTESEFATTGLAPEADLYGYRVLGPTGSGQSSWIIAGIEKAVADGMDVINLSLGNGMTSILYPTAIACNNAALAGVVPVIANGNSGPNTGTMGAPATSPLSISVGASTTDISLPTFDLTTSVETALKGMLLLGKLSSFDSFEDKDMEIVYGGYGMEYELEELDLEGKILFVDRGEIPFVEKFQNAMAKGAAAVIVANNVPGNVNLFLGEPKGIIPGMAISQEDGVNLKKALGIENTEENIVEEAIEENTAAQDQEIVEEAANKAVTIKINKDGIAKLTPDKLADFSSRGPASDETIKPDIVAPGVGILSTYPYFITNPNDSTDYSEAYARIDGTSMAAPHIAGVAALMLQHNKDLTPVEVKINMMNTAEKLAEDYNINAAGAGRINAYEAVHTEVSIRVLDKTISLDAYNEKYELDYITGSLSFDRIAKKNEDESRTLPLEITNKGDLSKTFKVSVEFLGESVKAQNAAANGVTLDIPETLTVAAGETSKFEATINVPAEANLGIYEGYITVTNVENEEENYRLPFNTNFLVPGLDLVDFTRPAMSNDLEFMHAQKVPGIGVFIQPSSPMSHVEVYVKDYETKEILGLATKEDISFLPVGYVYDMYAINGRGTYLPMDKNGKITYVPSMLLEGKYTLELIAYDADTDAIYNYEYDFIIDNQDCTMETNIVPGLYEVNEGMLTTEELFGQATEAFWIKGNVDDNSISILQDMGYEVDKSYLSILTFIHGNPRFGLPVDSEGNFKFGIEMSDLDNGMYEVSPMPTDIATSQNLFLPPRFFFVKEGDPYFGVALNKDKMVEKENITASLNIKNVTGNKFETKLTFTNAFEIMDIRVAEDLQKILDENNYTAKISRNVSGTGFKTLGLLVEIFDANGNPAEVGGDISLIDIEYKLMSELEVEQYKAYFECREGLTIYRNNEEDPTVLFKGYYEGVEVIMEDSMLVTFQYGEGYNEVAEITMDNRDLDKYLWIEDPQGNRYDMFYDEKFNEMRVLDIPTTLDEYTIKCRLPGHFETDAKFRPGRMVNGELTGKKFYALGSEYYRYPIAGDANGDGVIDILDAIELEKYYGQQVDYNEVSVDFNFDGVVNGFDMDYVVYNFGAGNEQVENKPEVKYTHEGRGIKEVLEAVGYFNEQLIQELNVDKNFIELELGETDKITGTILPEGVPNVNVVYSSDNEKAVKIDENGNIEAVGPGFANISISSSDRRLKLICFVQVTLNGEYIYPEDIVIDNPIRELYVGEEFELNYEVLPYESAVNTITFNSSADSIVSIKDGKAIAHQPGKVFISVELDNESRYTVWEVTVKEKEDPKPEISLESIKLNKNKLNLDKGEEAQLEVTFKPEDATNKNVTWSSSNEKVAKVVDGKVVAVGKGEAVITVTSEEGGFTDTCKVKVKEKNGGKPDGSLPQTGAVAGASMAMALGAVAVGAGLFINRKRKNNDNN